MNARLMLYVVLLAAWQLLNVGLNLYAAVEPLSLGPASAEELAHGRASLHELPDRSHATPDETMALPTNGIECTVTN